MTIKRNPDGRPGRTDGGAGRTARAPDRATDRGPGAAPGVRTGVRTCGYADMGRWTRMDWSRPTATQTTNIDEPP